MDYNKLNKADIRVSILTKIEEWINFKFDENPNIYMDLVSLHKVTIDYKR